MLHTTPKMLERLKTVHGSERDHLACRHDSKVAHEQREAILLAAQKLKCAHISVHSQDWSSCQCGIAAALRVLEPFFRPKESR